MSEKTIFTVHSVDVCPSEPIETETVGSWPTREGAVRGCVGYIMERLELRDDIRYAIMNDENHPWVAENVGKKMGLTEAQVREREEFNFGNVPHTVRFSPEWQEAIMEELFGALDVDSLYEIVTGGLDEKIGACTFIFEVWSSKLYE